MGKCGSRSWVCKVIGRYINSLYRCDGTLSGRSDTLLKGTHLSGQCGLITYRGRHTSKKCGNLGTSLCKTENIINEKKHILILHITEILCHSQPGKTNTHTRSRRLVHLTINQCSLVDNAALLHLIIKVITLTGTLTNTCKYGQSAVCCGNIVDQLHNKNCFANTSTSKQTDLTTLCRHLLLIGWCRTVNCPVLFRLWCRKIVYRITKKIKYSSKALFSNRNLDRFTSIYSLGSSYQTIGGIHGDTAYRIIPDLLSNLCCELCAFMINFDGIKKCRQLVMPEPDIQYRTDYLHHLANVFFAHLAVSL